MLPTAPKAPPCEQVLFEVRRCQFSALVEAGKQQEALSFARKQLTPIAGGDAELMQEVRNRFQGLELAFPHLARSFSQCPRALVCIALSLCTFCGSCRLLPEVRTCPDSYVTFDTIARRSRRRWAPS
jgi:hypothetical protein